MKIALLVIVEDTAITARFERNIDGLSPSAYYWHPDVMVCVEARTRKHAITSLIIRNVIVNALQSEYYNASWLRVFKFGHRAINAKVSWQYAQKCYTDLYSVLYGNDYDTEGY